ncbi:MAG: prolipoprotein diacylglyceryl transferase [Firmicutes bacterium]|nr:prolipoprotein diacylglyceryl transferase [Bacillota bacterium]
MISGLEWFYYVFIVIGLFVCVFLVLPKITKKYGMDKQSDMFYSILALIAIGLGIGGAILFQFIYDAIKYGFDFPDGYNPGMTFLGGLITGTATFIIGMRYFAKPETKAQFWIILRAFAPCVLIAHAFGRIGCFFGGCCYGEEIHGFPGMIAPDHSIAANALNGGLAVEVIPTQLIEAIFLFGMFFICYFLFMDKSLIIYLFSYGIFRFVLEFFRGDDEARGVITVLSPSQFICIGLIIAGGILLWFDINKGMFKKYIPPEKPAETGI